MISFGHPIIFRNNSILNIRLTLEGFFSQADLDFSGNCETTRFVYVSPPPIVFDCFQLIVMWSYVKASLSSFGLDPFG